MSASASFTVTCPNGHNTVQVPSIIQELGQTTRFNMSCGCRNTPAQILTGSSVSGTTLNVGSIISGYPINDGIYLQSL